MVYVTYPEDICKRVGRSHGTGVRENSSRRETTYRERETGREREILKEREIESLLGTLAEGK